MIASWKRKELGISSNSVDKNGEDTSGSNIALITIQILHFVALEVTDDPTNSALPEPRGYFHQTVSSILIECLQQLDHLEIYRAHK